MRASCRGPAIPKLAQFRALAHGGAVVHSAPPVDEALRRSNESAILTRLAKITGVRVAERLGVSASTVTRMSQSDIADIASLLAALDMRVVDADTFTAHPATCSAVLELARQRVASMTLDDLKEN